jgi:ABC-type uncharacterized transport system substrate-binding protein
MLGSAVVAQPLAARAQPTAMPVIGFMSARSPEDTVQVLEAFYKGLGEGGFVSGRNVNVEYRWARPGANVTGSVILTEAMEQKRFGILRETVPDVALFGAIVNPNYPASADQMRDLERAAPILGRQLFVAKASNDAELDAAFAVLLRERVGALLVASDPYFDSRRGRIIAFAAQNRLPAIYQFREYTVEGGLISYGPSITDAYRQVGMYVARILKGEKPADLPVLQPTKFDFVINLKTAKALGLIVPPTLLARVDEVIE